MATGGVHSKEGQTDRQVGMRTDRQTDRQTNRQTDRQNGRGNDEEIGFIRLNIGTYSRWHPT